MKTAPENNRQPTITARPCGSAHRLALMITPTVIGSVIDQTTEALANIREQLRQQSESMTVTLQTVFVRSSSDIPTIRKMMEEFYADQMPPTTFLTQAPCDGQALAIEAWAIGGSDVDIRFLNPSTVSVSYDGLRWVYVNGITAPSYSVDAYQETHICFEKMTQHLEFAEATFNDVTRIWLYQAQITELENGDTDPEKERYRELNRSRTDYFDELEKTGKMSKSHEGRAFYPPSTGIGTVEGNLTASCLALQTERDDVRLIPLENPNQTAAFDYAKSFSAKSPKFSRAMAMITDDYTTTWVSGTASILDAESVHLEDIEKQTEQTIDNIEALVCAENLTRHGADGSGSLLTDFAKVRVYIKRLADYEKCRAVCERRFGDVPKVYVIADVCRSELLVEIEGVAFSTTGA